MKSGLKFLGSNPNLRNVNVFKNMKKKPITKKKNSILVWINTYNRPDQIDKLLYDIKKNKEHYSIKIVIIDDNSNLSYDKVIKKYNGDMNIIYMRMKENYGKMRYWELCNFVISQIMTFGIFDYYVKLDDDVRLIDYFFRRCINIWNSINDPRKICLNFRLDTREGKKVWTNTLPQRMNFNGIDVYRSQWVDMDFFVTRDFFRTLKYKISNIPLTRWKRNHNISSGVGRDISIRLNNMNYSLYLTTQTLVEHDEVVSVMNPIERKINPLNTKPLKHNSEYGL